MKMPHDPEPAQHHPVHPKRLAALQHSPHSETGQDKPTSLKTAAMTPITTTDALAGACDRLSKHSFVTVDTEFLRESTYYPLLCVAQMASPEEAVVVDALAKGIDLTPFYELMANERVLKIFHAARQDIEIVWHQAQRIPHPIFDTQVAAMVLGYGDSISYDQLVQRVTGDNLDKSHRFTDWSRRPLSAAQLVYAISDVTHLRDVYLVLAADLERRGRTDWVFEEMAVLTSPQTYRADPETAWERLKTRVRKPKELAVLVEVAAWREREAQSRDVPRGRVLKDEALGDIATHAPTTAERLASLRSLPRGFERSKWGQEILDAVQRGLVRDPSTLPPFDRPRTSANVTATVELLKVLLRMTSEQHGVAAKVIATVDDLERLAADDRADIPALKGWRGELFGEQAIALKHGHIALAVDKGRVVIVQRDREQHAPKRTLSN
jgi:ribonuclease D